MDWKWSGELLISAAGAANAPNLFNGKYKLLRTAGAELINGQISKEVMETLEAPVMPAQDYRQMTTLSFEGGLIAKAKMASIAIKAMRGAKKST
jgi:hypothetical protein